MAGAGERTPGREATVTVAAAQTRTVTGRQQRNNEQSLELVHQACDQGAQLLVLSGLGNPGYMLNARPWDEERQSRRPSPSAR